MASPFCEFILFDFSYHLKSGVNESFPDVSIQKCSKGDLKDSE